MNSTNDLPPAEKARSLFERATAARREGCDPDAHDSYTEALAIFREQGDLPGVAACLLALADLARHHNPTGEDEFALRKTRAGEALAIYREAGDKRGESRALRLLASVAMPKEERLRLLQESLALAREVDDRSEVAASLERLGANTPLGEERNALLDASLAEFREAGDRDGEGMTLFSLAISVPTRRYEYAQEAVRIYRELGRKKRVAEILILLGWRAPDDETRIARYTEAQEIAREIGIPGWEASCLRSLAKIADLRGELQHAQALREEANQISPEPEMDPPFDMRGHELTGLNGQGADWHGRRLQGAELTNVDLSEAILAFADLSGATLNTVALTRANLQDTHLCGAQLSLVDLTGANLADADLRGALLGDCSLEGSTLTGADLRGVLFESMMTTTPYGVNLRRANLCGADLRGADLDGATLEGAKYNEETQWPDGFNPAEHGAVHAR